MNDFVDSITKTLDLVKENVPFVLMLLGLLLVIHIVNTLLGGRLNILGIFPRHLFGLVGIVFSPFLHADFNHLFFNAIPLFVLANLVLLEGMQIFLLVTLCVILLSGTLTWCFGRRGLHIGASGLIMGYWSYLLTNAYSHETGTSIVLGIVCIYYFSGFFFQIFPGKKTTSWEGHLFGALSGIAVALLLPRFM